MDELQKWIELARQNFSDNNFFVWFNATKAFKDFQNSNLPLTQDSYRAQLAIINGLLINYLDLSDNKILQTSKIAYMILHLDKLILKAESIAGMNDGLNCLAKCLLYMRIGDYILGLNSSNAMFQSKAQKQTFLAIHSYCRAHQWACQHWNRHIEYSDPLLLVCLLELKILIEKNWDEAFDRKMNVYNDNDLLFTLLNNVAHGQFKEENSFMLTDKTILMKKNNFQKFNTNFVDLVMEKAHKLRGNVNFLRQFVWILANNSSYFEQNNYKFLNKFYPNLPECPLDPHNAGSPETFSLIDIKLFLYRLTRHLKCISPRDDTILLPWLFYQKPTGSQQQFWKAMNRFLDLPNDCSELQLLMEIEKGLEQIRVPPTMSGPTAVESALCTIKFVKQMLRMMPENADRKAREFCHILMQRYSEAIGGEEIPESDWVLVVEQSQGDGNGGVEQISLQPKIENIEEEFGNEPSEIVHQEQNEGEQQMKTVKTNSSISTQTDIVCENPQEIGENTQLQQQNALLLQQQDWRIRRDLGEVDFHINRWVQHNKALRTLFI